MNKRLKRKFIQLLAATLLITSTAIIKDYSVYADNTKKSGQVSQSEKTGKTTQVSKKEELNSIDLIKKACESVAACQKDLSLCAVDIENAHNPYDVEWDYGEEWQKYVDACDWSLVFDAKYYKKTFPMLAIQYNNDDKLLLEHFQTVGVHEGRQGCKAFNVDAYRRNCSKKVYDAFRYDIEGFYIYYMLNYDKEKEYNTVTANSGKEIKKQTRTQLTALQKLELDGINKWREKVGAESIDVTPEFNAFANYRAYIQRVGKYGMNDEGHIWAQNNKNTMLKYMDICFPENTNYSLYENTITSKNTRPKSNYYRLYADHKEHYDAMVDKTDKYAGISNCYYNKSIYTASQYDLFVHEVK